MRLYYFVGLIMGIGVMWSIMVNVCSYKFNQALDEANRCDDQNKPDSAIYYHVKSRCYLELENNLGFNSKKRQP